MTANRSNQVAAFVKPDCPKWDTCNAAICPLLPDWRAQYHASGGEVCPYMPATGKAGAAERFAGNATFAAVLGVTGAVCEKYPDIARRVAEASRSGFRGKTPEQMAEWRARRKAVKAA